LPSLVPLPPSPQPGTLDLEASLLGSSGRCYENDEDAGSIARPSNLSGVLDAAAAEHVDGSFEDAHDATAAAAHAAPAATQLPRRLRSAVGGALPLGSASLDDLAMLGTPSKARHWFGGGGPGGGSGRLGADALTAAAARHGGGLAGTGASGVRAVEVRTPEEALQLMVIARLRPFFLAVGRFDLHRFRLLRLVL
jgi:hypothetical protein